MAVPLPNGILPGMRAHELKGLEKGTRAIMTPTSKWFRVYHELGEHEGCGIMLMIARLDVRGEGIIEPEELKQLWRDVETHTENVLGFVTTAMVVATLALSVTVPLVLWPHDTPDVEVASLGASWPWLAAWYGSWMKSPALPFVHWVETMVLSASTGVSVFGAISGLVVYSNLAIYATDAESKLYCMYDNYSAFAKVFICGLVGLLSLLLGVILLSARISPVACITLSISFSVIFATVGGAPFQRRTMVAPALNQLRIAKGILAAAKGKGAQIVATRVEYTQ